ncbi:NAD(P)/FAD-dependent oxidoreductase [Neorhizobium lilium]|uniref:Pyridine nucleotide-disulfide oxidoreductase domain-containing protein 2 n=1 Tax=Neorhizobium lilium TaxID=2503024 RepID=A0A3S3VHK1_9HYPH|nr:NAD(P)/FAD-dependent oxidoreductase [Neorhizobium lilium]RWX74701.1 NAD(P)/FAD-dependent oxidoreductase [Neorhizobium lilium]
MSQNYDVIAVGAGHHGLIAAAYLAKAGKSVLVLERNDHPGGGCVTMELAPGYRYDEHSTIHQVILSNPMIKNDELGLLSQFGLEYIFPEAVFSSYFDDGSVLTSYRSVDKSVESIAQFSKADAESYRRFSEMAFKLFPMLGEGMFTPAAPMADVVAGLSQSRDGNELLMMMLKSGLDIVSEWFAHEKVRMHFVKLMSENLQAPYEKGTGIGALAMLGAAHVTGLALPKGGSGKLTEALVKCVEHHGGVVLTGKTVTRLLRSGDRVTGVETDTGESYGANDGVIGAIHPHHLRRYFGDINEGVLHRAERVQMATYSAMYSHFALREPIKIRGDSGDEGRGLIIELLPSSLETLQRAFDEYRYARLPDPIPHYSLTQHSDHDPSRAPAGGAIFSMMTFAPYDIRHEGKDNWDDLRNVWPKKALKDSQKWLLNLDRDNIIASIDYSPLDLERSSPSFVRGDIHGAAPFFYQMNGHRPTPDLAQYTVPGIEGFYLVGPFMHPGSGLTGAGRATAAKMMQDMGIDFAKVAGS